jgi:hypothetical protein
MRAQQIRISRRRGYLSGGIRNSGRQGFLEMPGGRLTGSSSRASFELMRKSPDVAVWPLAVDGESLPEEFNHARTLFQCCAIATVIDAGGTIIHVARGARELNPIWASLMDQIGPVAAMGIRLAVGLLLLSILLLLWQRPLARFGLVLLLAAFVPLTLYHLFLMIYVPLAG